MTVTIAAERPDIPDAVTLITELEAHLMPFYPQESRHGYSVEKLVQQNVAFFIARTEGQLAGCGGVQLYGQEYGELKRMYVRPHFRGQGIARQMLVHLVAHTRQQGIPLVRLETGIHQQEAVRLYERFGFYEIGPFGEYKNDPLSLYYELPA